MMHCIYESIWYNFFTWKTKEGYIVKQFLIKDDALHLWIYMIQVYTANKTERNNKILKIWFKVKVSFSD